MSQYKIIKAEKFCPTNRSYFNPDIETKSQVSDIINLVYELKDQALISLTKQFDMVIDPVLKVDMNQMQSTIYFSLEQLDALNLAIARITDYHQRQKKETWFFNDKLGNKLGQIVRPINRVGVYIDSSVAYLSTVLMTIIPAQLAGVKEIAVVSAPSKNGLPQQSILNCLKLLGINEVYAVGGAQAIAALALGTETIPAVDKIVGSGNKYVSEAKRQLYGVVGVDSLAGNNEVLIYLADDEVAIDAVVADLIAQAEHAVNSRTMLITHSILQAEAINNELKYQLNSVKRVNIVSQSIEQNGLIIIADNQQQVVELINLIAPEQLQLMGETQQLVPHIYNAGAIYEGNYSSAVMGDYIAGTNHNLATSGKARFLSALGVDDFSKSISYCAISEYGFKNLAPRAIRLAELEGLYAHAEALNIRLTND